MIAQHCIACIACSECNVKTKDKLHDSNSMTLDVPTVVSVRILIPGKLMMADCDVADL